ncbi:hypothetical protein BJY24_000790 [Nocardia transvalensis]|uniref:Uncharacterized protein n=1 Tax=Nocardia transvalensis TaxID=37333 RepID=A0A7W9PA03_9NOCA|nr:hypothetical protein [Nocardia transvalensis]MBB5911923.1 hypothetical protein [Nocardia transvalensis]
MFSDAITMRIRLLTARASRSGYHLVRASSPPYSWTLLDAEDGEGIYSTPDLDQIEYWLDS